MSEKNNFKKYQSKETNASSYTLREEEILAYWNEHDIFKKTLEKSFDKNQDKGDFIFYEGPPTANGRPGIHHVESRAFKDAIPRYKTMQGYRVARRAGWDTHGLPVELEVEKQLGLTSKKQIEEYGIEKFNAQCRVSVWKYVNEWEDFTKRIGYWVDLEHPYITYHNDYVETLWWVMQQIADKDLLYKDYKVVPWCPRCGTGLSSHELAQGYADVKDLSITAKFELVDEPGTFVLAWTTTPWTLPGNVGLAVGKKVTYGRFKIQDIGFKNEEFIIAVELAEKVFKGFQYELVQEFKGKDLVGKSYKPLFSHFKTLAEKSGVKNLENAYKIYAADFVTTTDGTGIVHTAVMYGQDDFVLGNKVGLPKMHLVKEDGTFISGTGFLEGRFVKEETDGKPTLDIDIIKYLQENKTFFNKEKYEHSYPHCWRCKTPLIYYARDSWYINMQAVKDKLISENNEINWEPSHVREGRFGEWLLDVKDWAISRERYWGTPLPIWQAEDGEKIVIGSYDELKKYTKKSGNRYFVMRHGEGEHNVQNVANSDPKNIYNLTEKGKEQACATAQTLKDKGITKIFYSPLPRGKQTAEIVATELGLTEKDVIQDVRLRELNYGTLEGKAFSEFIKWRDTSKNFYTDKNSENAESYFEAKKRIGELWYDIDTRYSNENILFVAHGVLLESAPAITEGADIPRAIELFKQAKHTTGTAREIVFSRLPHNENFELDPHRPFIDSIVLEHNGKEFHRVKEVIDVWFDSGCMPFAQGHYLGTGELAYPADFICEGMDQTRGWFYTLHAIGNLLGRGKAYKNVISVGLINDEEGQKMSKSRGNTVNPWDAIHMFGVDTLRFWMYSVNAPGEAKNFDEKMIIETQRKVFGLLDNVVKFYELYDDKLQSSGHKLQESENILDQWIVERLNQLIELCMKSMDHYQFLEPTRAIRDFIADLSQWYIRRSRDRFKSEDIQDRNAALVTTRQVLLELAKIMAPFTPFFAEDIYKRVGGERESVHLENWPAPGAGHGDRDTQVLKGMEMTRNIISEALEARAHAGIKVRQVLAKLTIKQGLSEEYRALIQDEVNVKEVVLGEALLLDTTITPELEAEGNMRELIRAIQDMRKTKGLVQNDRIVLVMQTDEVGKNLVEQFEREIQKTAGVEKFVFQDNDGEEVTVGVIKFKIVIQ